MLRFVSVLVALFALTASSSFATDRCGDGGRCVIENGYYLAKLPANWDRNRALPLVVFFHGWNATPEGMFRNRGLVDGVTRRGAIFVAPFAQTGYWRQIGAGRAEPGRDELRYVRALMDDINRRWPIDAERTLASGFSRGASMVWNVACYAGPLFKAYLPIGGGFWNSTPETCPTGLIHMRHIHGLKDGVVAYGEVGIYNSMPIPDGLAVLRKLNRCTAQRTATAAPSPRLQCKTWSDCAGGRRLEVCLHGGGHSIPAEWVGEGLDWMRTLIR